MAAGGLLKILPKIIKPITKPLTWLGSKVVRPSFKWLGNKVLRPSFKWMGKKLGLGAGAVGLGAAGLGALKNLFSKSQNESEENTNQSHPKESETSNSSERGNNVTQTGAGSGDDFEEAVIDSDKRKADADSAEAKTHTDASRKISDKARQLSSRSVQIMKNFGIDSSDIKTIIPSALFPEAKADTKKSAPNVLGLSKILEKYKSYNPDPRIDRILQLMEAGNDLSALNNQLLELLVEGQGVPGLAKSAGAGVFQKGASDAYTKEHSLNEEDKESRQAAQGGRFDVTVGEGSSEEPKKKESNGKTSSLLKTLGLLIPGLFMANAAFGKNSNTGDQGLPYGDDEPSIDDYPEGETPDFSEEPQGYTALDAAGAGANIAVNAAYRHAFQKSLTKGLAPTAGNVVTKAAEKPGFWSKVGNNIVKGGSYIWDKAKSLWHWSAPARKWLGKVPGVKAGASPLKGMKSIAGKTIGKAIGKAGFKTALKKIPVAGLLFGLGFGISRALKGDWVGAIGELASGASSLLPPPAGQALGVAIDSGLAYKDYKQATKAEQQLQADIDSRTPEEQEKIAAELEALSKKSGVKTEGEIDQLIDTAPDGTKETKDFEEPKVDTSAWDPVIQTNESKVKGTSVPTFETTGMSIFPTNSQVSSSTSPKWSNTAKVEPASTSVTPQRTEYVTKPTTTETQASNHKPATYRQPVGNKKEFIDLIAPGALAAAKKYGIKPSLIMAQAALESGWGKKAPGNMLFGIKAGKNWKGKKQLLWTHEYYGGVKHRIQDWFRAYDSLADSIEDHGRFLSVNPRYKKVLESKDYLEATKAIKDAGYATAPDYTQALRATIESNGFNKFDNMLDSPRNMLSVENQELLAKADTVGVPVEDTTPPQNNASPLQPDASKLTAFSTPKVDQTAMKTDWSGGLVAMNNVSASPAISRPKIEEKAPETGTQNNPKSDGTTQGGDVNTPVSVNAPTFAPNVNVNNNITNIQSNAPKTAEIIQLS